MSILQSLIVAAALAQAANPYDRILQGGSAAAISDHRDPKLVCWNIERGLELPEIEAALKKMRPAIALLQEVDLNARRTGKVHVAERLAQSLGMKYIYAVEFEELGQGGRKNPAYQGQALLSALPATSARILRFRNQSGFWKPRWYLPNWAMFQRREGGRLALAAEIAVGSQRLVVYNVHLESRGGEELRLRQIEEVISDAGRYGAETPILIAGDFNTQSTDSPVFQALFRSGFRKAVGQEITTDRGKALDWIFERGRIRLANGKIHREVSASDHFPLSVEIEQVGPE